MTTKWTSFPLSQIITSTTEKEYENKPKQNKEQGESQCSIMTDHDPSDCGGRDTSLFVTQASAPAKTTQIRNG